MALEAFIEKRFSRRSLATIEQVNTILSEYAEQGLTLTLRQLYYQFVARGLLPNKQLEYKRLGSIVSDARLAGLVDWDMMEDRTRFLRTISHWDYPAQILRVAAKQYKTDLWQDQPYRPEVWIEKDALVGVIERACSDLRVEYFACRGYTSQSAQYEAGQRFRMYRAARQRPIVFHLGDHDPSGIDMTRDNTERLSMFACTDVEVRRLALNMDQIEQYNPPPNPAKETDARASGYISRYGYESWELDALDPAVIDRMLRDNIEGLIDRAKWDAQVADEERGRNTLEAIAGRWDEVVMFIGEDNDDDFGDQDRE